MNATTLPFAVLSFSRAADNEDFPVFQIHVRVAANQRPLAAANTCTCKPSPQPYDAIDTWHFADEDAARAWAPPASATVVDGAMPEGGLLHAKLLISQSGMSAAAFRTHRRDVHGPIAAAMPAVRRFLQLVPATDTGTSGFDGVALLWLDSMEALRDNARRRAPGVVAGTRGHAEFRGHGGRRPCSSPHTAWHDFCCPPHQDAQLDPALRQHKESQETTHCGRPRPRRA